MNRHRKGNRTIAEISSGINHTLLHFWHFAGEKCQTTVMFAELDGTIILRGFHEFYTIFNLYLPQWGQSQLGL